jgi:hypothetical protein
LAGSNSTPGFSMRSIVSPSWALYSFSSQLGVRQRRALQQEQLGVGRGCAAGRRFRSWWRIWKHALVTYKDTQNRWTWSGKSVQKNAQTEMTRSMGATAWQCIIPFQLWGRGHFELGTVYRVACIMGMKCWINCGTHLNDGNLFSVFSGCSWNHRQM